MLPGDHRRELLSSALVCGYATGPDGELHRINYSATLAEQNKPA